MAGLWFKPVCDDLLGKIHRWWVNYERGEIFSTREWLDREGNKVDKPTRYAYRIPFRPLEIQHLVSILEALAPTNSLTKDMKELHESMKHRFINLNLKNRPRLLPTGEWIGHLGLVQGRHRRGSHASARSQIRQVADD